MAQDKWLEATSKASEFVLSISSVIISLATRLHWCREQSLLFTKLIDKTMKINQITTTLVALAMLVLPAVSSANTYQYIDSGGRLQSTQANSSNEALATANNIALHSGVVLVSVEGIGGNYEPTTTNTTGNFYQFVDKNGNVQSVNAMNSSVALATAPNIALHSGVILVTNSTTVN